MYYIVPKTDSRFSHMPLVPAGGILHYQQHHQPTADHYKTPLNGKHLIVTQPTDTPLPHFNPLLLRLNPSSSVSSPSCEQANSFICSSSEQSPLAPARGIILLTGTPPRTVLPRGRITRQSSAEGSHIENAPSTHEPKADGATLSTTRDLQKKAPTTIPTHNIKPLPPPHADLNGRPAPGVCSRLQNLKFLSTHTSLLDA